MFKFRNVKNSNFYPFNELFKSESITNVVMASNMSFRFTENRKTLCAAGNVSLAIHGCTWRTRLHVPTAAQVAGLMKTSEAVSI